ncbi:hypothetical protein D3C80_1969370 [compost metagenome]
MRDKHNADAFGLQAANHAKQAFAFGAIERGGGFIEHQKTTAVGERACQQHLLFFRQGALRQTLAQVNSQIQLSQ